jgi:hyperosmotically inducible protein
MSPEEELRSLSASLRPLAAAACAAAALVLAACDRPVLPAPAEAPAPKPADAAQPSPAKPAQRPADNVSLVELPEGPPSDAKITADATQALRADPALAGTDLSVTTTHGVVSLTGTVRSPEQVAIAEARAQSPTGVMRVETHVSVAPG